MKTWYDWTTANIRSARKQLNLLQQRAYAAGLTTIRPVASRQVEQPMNPWKQAPASAPLTDLQELLDWTPDTKPFQNLLRATVQLSQARRKESQAQRPRLLVCHDLNGNYHADALPQGSGDADYYRLTQWSSIDVFVYFSHALVTIPPPGWINAAHTNGVPVRLPSPPSTQDTSHPLPPPPSSPPPQSQYSLLRFEGEPPPSPQPHVHLTPGRQQALPSNDKQSPKGTDEPSYIWKPSRKHCNVQAPS